MVKIMGKTLANVYEIATHNPTVYTALSLYNQNIGRVAMFDILVALVCALDEENQELRDKVIWYAERTVEPAYQKINSTTRSTT